ncbi:hypothetical protein [Pelagibius sp. Alg239-R121]|uniref:hypothetical protein n=1 Tax=Pelagibius sp. Alg239-R121 TaxID=2993448 RepID=UPI0024A74E96|nr:hypothetical protein [Pelagibius sp. Alg239-R121]
MTAPAIAPDGGELELGDVRKDRQVRANSGLYAFGGVALLIFFSVVERDPTLLENAGLVLAIIGIVIDVRTALHMKRMERPDQATARSQEKKVFRTRWTTFVTCRIVSLSVAIFCGAAFAFGDVFMCWLHGPELTTGCSG